MHNQQTLLNITCSVKSKPRVITLTRSDRNQPLPFRIGGVAGSGSGGIFISEVEPNSMAERAGLKRGDEVGSCVKYFVFVFKKSFKIKNSISFRFSK